MESATVPTKNSSIYKYLIVIWFSYVSSGNNFDVNAAINNDQYCSITKKHTMCSPEVRVIYIYIIYYIYNMFMFEYIFLQILVIARIFMYRAMDQNVAHLQVQLGVLVKTISRRFFMSIINGELRLRMDLLLEENRVPSLQELIWSKW